MAIEGNVVTEQADGTFQFSDGRRVYPFHCPTCGHEAYAAPSLMMLAFGHNSGSAGCSQCGEYLSLSIAPDLDGDRMNAVVLPQHPEPAATDGESGEKI